MQFAVLDRSRKGLRFRTVAGRKADEDVVLEAQTPTGWWRVTMTLLAVLVDHLVENEEHLRRFRPHWKMSARDKLFAFLNLAIDQGWEAARDSLEQERAESDRRVPAPPPETVAAQPQWKASDFDDMPF